MTPFRFLFVLLFLSTSIHLHAQLTQTIRGIIVDQVTQSPLPGASVVLINSQPLVGTTTDVDGQFRLTQIPVGVQALRISFIGYKDMTIPGIVVNSAK